METCILVFVIYYSWQIGRAPKDAIASSIQTYSRVTKSRLLSFLPLSLKQSPQVFRSHVSRVLQQTSPSLVSTARTHMLSCTPKCHHQMFHLLVPFTKTTVPSIIRLGAERWKKKHHTGNGCAGKKNRKTFPIPLTYIAGESAFPIQLAYQGRSL